MKKYMNEKISIQKTSMISGGVLALSVIAYNLYHAFMVSKGLPFMESLLPELIKTVIISIIMLLPALALMIKEDVGHTLSKVSLVYPTLVGVGFLSILVSEDQLAAGVFMFFVVMPFCLIFGAILFWKNKK